ncbi:hypothetical protein [Salinirubellus litoreus]|uniref:hypothetical protein n=1 Tax=unclassified Salinirubellus TaxID=2627207 RepID=UPI00361B2636
MTVRLRAAPGDDVRAVGAVLADRPQELPTAGYRLAERRAQFDRGIPVETVGLPAEREEQVVPVGLDARAPRLALRALTGATRSGEFLDQPPSGGLPYPPGSSACRAT